MQQRERLREIGIHDLETFLAASPFNPDMDKIIIRLADLNYEQAQKDYGLAMDKFNSSCCEDENTPKTFGDSLAPQPELDYSRSLELYQRIINEYPQSVYVDDAIYNKGFLLEELGELEEATDNYKLLVTTYPDSAFTPDAL